MILIKPIGTPVSSALVLRAVSILASAILPLSPSAFSSLILDSLYVSFGKTQPIAISPICFSMARHCLPQYFLLAIAKVASSCSTLYAGLFLLSSNSNSYPAAFNSFPIFSKLPAFSTALNQSLSTKA
jgi:hypothetical protein